MRPEILVCRWLLPHGVLESVQKDTNEITKEPTLNALNHFSCRHCLQMFPAEIPTGTYTSPYDWGGGVYSPITNHRIHRGLAETPGRPRVRANLKGLSSQTALSPILIGPDLGMLVSQVHGEHIRLALLHSIVQGQFRDKN